MRLDVRLIVPGSDGRTVLLTTDGALPSFATEGDADEAAVVAVDRALRVDLGFRSSVLETHPRWSDVPDGEPIPTLATTEKADPDWEQPAGLAFAAIPDEPVDLPPVLLPRAREWLAELRAGAPPPPLRPRWARPGWNARASAWMRDAAAAAGRPLTDEPRPFFLRGISALLQAPTATGDLFLKAVFPPFHAEPVLTHLLAERFPAHLPPVLAIEPDEGWLLVDRLDGTWIGELPEEQRPLGLAAGARAIVEIQAELAGRRADLERLLDAGAPHRPLGGVPAAFAASLGPDGVAIVEGPLAEAQRERAVSAVDRAVARVATLGLPETVVHGDFHSGNAALVDGRVVIIDWSDAALGNPAVDLVTWISWSYGKIGEIGRAIDAWIDAWSAVVDPVALRERVDDVRIVGAAYQVISYDGIVHNLEPLTRYTMSGGASHFLKELETILDRSS